ncbi:unnamed protein product [Rangifer tarandus platyrhynchus]|uniref:Uncharacterized protein n=1 Tax=Rangifer tarandus platyrhynchus TaxID=3082113 RepID=A0ABN8YG47_RANTA|nr:unnamed protein product [Rangifer tarandus platyrhynchus]
MSADRKPWSIGTEFPRVCPAQTDPGKALRAVPNSSVWASPPQVEEAHTPHTQGSSQCRHLGATEELSARGMRCRALAGISGLCGVPLGETSSFSELHHV